MSYEYRADGELDKLSGTKAGQTSSFTYLDNISYNTLGNIEKMRLGNGTWETAEYNTRQQVSQIALGSSANTQNLLKIDYTYKTQGQNDNNGSLRQQKISYTGLANEIVQDYVYDDLNRLQSATETPAGSSVSWQQTFNYDRYGNRTFDANNTDTLSGSSPSKVTNPTIQTSNNRLTENQDGGAIDYDYDANGNLTLDAENKRFVYNAENQIKEFFKGTNGGSTPDATYEYDGDGKRVRKVEETANGQVETIFVYNASGQLVAEYSNQMPEEPKASYLTADHLGSPRVITDGLGAVVSRHDYTAFGDDVTDTIGNVGGRTTAQGYGEEDEIRKGYTGYERDDESGLDFAQARYYNSMHGRFTSVDPLTASANVKNPQTFNRYSYVLNSPYKFVDPLGLVSVNTAACGNWCSNKDGNPMAGLGIGLYSTNGQVIGIGQQQQQKGYYIDKSSGELVCKIECNNTLSTNIVGKPYEPVPSLADAVYGPNDGKVKLLDYSINQSDLPVTKATGQRLNHVEYTYTFTLELIDIITGESWKDIAYEISYDQGVKIDPSKQGRQLVPSDGVIPLGPFSIDEKRTAPTSVEGYTLLDAIDIFFTGTVTIYNKSGVKLAESDFRATVKGEKGTGQYVPHITETRRKVFTNPPKEVKIPIP